VPYELLALDSFKITSKHLKPTSRWLDKDGPKITVILSKNFVIVNSCGDVKKFKIKFVKEAIN